MRWSPRLIPRKTLNGIRRVQSIDQYGRVSDSLDETPFIIENAGVHPITGWELQTLPDGYRDKKAFKVYTTTELRSVMEGTNNLADLVEAQPGVFCTVIKVEDWNYNVQGHYLAYVVEVNER